MEGAARQGECERARGAACEVLNVFCAEAPAIAGTRGARRGAGHFVLAVDPRQHGPGGLFEAYLRQFSALATTALRSIASRPNNPILPDPLTRWVDPVGVSPGPSG